MAAVRVSNHVECSQNKAPAPTAINYWREEREEGLMRMWSTRKHFCAITRSRYEIRGEMGSRASMSLLSIGARHSSQPSGKRCFFVAGLALHSIQRRLAATAYSSLRAPYIRTTSVTAKSRQISDKQKFKFYIQ